MLYSSLVLAAPFQENDRFVYKSNACTSGYLSVKGYCVKNTDYDFKTTNTLMNDYNKQLDELLVHKLTINVNSGDTPVGDAPVQVLNTGSQSVNVLYLDGYTGLPKQQILGSYENVIVETAQNGNAALSFIVEDGTSGYIPKLKVGPVWMENEVVVDVTQDALDRVSNINADQLSAIQGTKQQHVKSVIASLSALQEFKENDTRFKLNDELDRVQDSDVKSAHVKQQNGIVKVVVDTVRGAVEFVVKSIKNALKAISWVLKQVGLTLVKVFHAVKAFFEWRDVIKSHQWLEKNLLAVRQESPKFIKGNEAKTIESLKKLKGDVGQKVDSILLQLHGKAPKELELVKNPAPQGQYLMNVVSKNAKLLEFQDATESDLQYHLQSLNTIVPRNETNLDKVRDAVNKALVAVGHGAKKVSIYIVSAVLKALQAVFDLFDEVIVLGAKTAAIVFYAVTELLWTVLTFQVSVPFVNELYAKLTGGSKISLLSLILLPTAAIATWAYKATHWGEAPFPQQEPINELELVGVMKGGLHKKSNGLSKRFLAAFLFFFFSVLIVFIALEVFLRILTAAIWLAIFMPFTFLGIVLFIFLIL